jgi:peptidoglycan-associated lipoprotein
MNTTMRVLVLALTVAGLAACAKKQTVAPPDDGGGNNVVEQPRTDPVADPDEGFKVGLSDPRSAACLKQRSVGFDFDQAVIRPEFQATISCHAKYLSYHPGARLTLEGHADERGSREYNLGLGERRGNAVSDLLQANGGKGDQLAVTSYGEERPTCNESSESCWANNRRVELVYTSEG